MKVANLAITTTDLNTLPEVTNDITLDINGATYTPSEIQIDNNSGVLLGVLYLTKTEYDERGQNPGLPYYEFLKLSPGSQATQALPNLRFIVIKRLTASTAIGGVDIQLINYLDHNAV